MDRSRASLLSLAGAGLLWFFGSVQHQLGPGDAQRLMIDGAVRDAAVMAKAPGLFETRLAAPALEFANADSEIVTLGRFSGRIVVLSLWAPWCEPCVKEMPSLNRLVTRVPGVAVVAVNVDARGLGGATEFLAKHSLTSLAPYYDPSGKMLGLLNGRGLPTSLIIDPDGRIAARVDGAVDWTSDSMLSLLLRV